MTLLFRMELSGQLLCCLPHDHILENIDGEDGAGADLERVKSSCHFPERKGGPPDTFS